MKTLITGLSLLLFSSGVSSAPPGTTHAELLAILLEKEIPLETRALPVFDNGDRTTAIFYPSDRPMGSVRVFLYRTEEQAKKAAAAMGATGFCHGRFAIEQFPRNNSAEAKTQAAELFARVRKALP